MPGLTMREPRLLNDRMEQIAFHTRLEPGKFSRMLGVRGFHGTVVSPTLITLFLLCQVGSDGMAASGAMADQPA